MGAEPGVVYFEEFEERAGQKKNGQWGFYIHEFSIRGRSGA